MDSCDRSLSIDGQRRTFIQRSEMCFNLEKIQGRPDMDFHFVQTRYGLLSKESEIWASEKVRRTPTIFLEQNG